MASPPKPWEKEGFNFNNTNDMASFLNSNGLLEPPQAAMAGNIHHSHPAMGNRTNPPPIPHRLGGALPNNAMQRLQAYGMSPGNPFFGQTILGNGLGSTYNTYGANRYTHDPLQFSLENRFVRMAEESSRPAFQSIESIVRAVGAISNMLDSTYNAVHSSFRAVLGVADQFTSVKTQLAQLFSTLAVLRTIKWCLKKILYLLGIVKLNPTHDMVWSQALNEQNKDAHRMRKSAWPIFAFFSIVLGAPWLIWKLLAQINIEANPDAWARGEQNHLIGVAQYDFKSENPRELSFKAGQEMKVALKENQPRVKGWMLASIDGVKIGFVPSNYIKVLGLRRAVPAPEIVGNTIPKTLTT